MYPGQNKNVNGVFYAEVMRHNLEKGEEAIQARAEYLCTYALLVTLIAWNVVILSDRSVDTFLLKRYKLQPLNYKQGQFVRTPYHACGQQK